MFEEHTAEVACHYGRTPLLSRSRDICRDGVVHYNPLYVLLVPVFERVRALGVQAARLPDSIPWVPARVFLSQYPEGHESGMAVHRDSMVAHVAVTLVVTTDAEGGCFFVASAAGVRRPVPLTEGWEVAVHPGTWHGV